jgi:hypothetical protein
MFILFFLIFAQFIFYSARSFLAFTFDHNPQQPSRPFWDILRRFWDKGQKWQFWSFRQKSSKMRLWFSSSDRIGAQKRGSHLPHLGTIVVTFGP